MQQPRQARVNTKPCYVSGCVNVLGISQHVTFHSIPRCPERRARWLQVLPSNGRKCSINSARICGAHFVSGKPNRYPHNIDYVPTLSLRCTRQSYTLSCINSTSNAAQQSAAQQSAAQQSAAQQSAAQQSAAQQSAAQQSAAQHRLNINSVQQASTIIQNVDGKLFYTLSDGGFDSSVGKTPNNNYISLQPDAFVKRKDVETSPLTEMKAIDNCNKLTTGLPGIILIGSKDEQVLTKNAEPLTIITSYEPYTIINVGQDQDICYPQ